MATQLSLSMERHLFDAICSPSALRRAFKDVRRNKGAPGVDGVTVQVFELSLARISHKPYAAPRQSKFLMPI